MANKWPAADGNWSTASNWNGGTKPVAGDVVYADGKTITIDEDVTVLQLRTNARSGGTAGGGFTTTAKVVINADSHADITTCLTVSTAAVQNGNSFGGSTVSRYGTVLTLGGVQNGNSFGGSAAGAPGTLAYYGGRQHGDSTGSANTFGTLIQQGGMHFGNATGVAGGIGTLVGGGGVALIKIATGVVTGVGVAATGSGQTVIIRSEVGAYAKSLNASTDTTYTNIPFAKPPTLNTSAAVKLGNRLAQRGVNL